MTQTEWDKFLAFWQDPQNYSGYCFAIIFILWLYCIFAISSLFFWTPVLMIGGFVGGALLTTAIMTMMSS